MNPVVKSGKKTNQQHKQNSFPWWWLRGDDIAMKFDESNGRTRKEEWLKKNKHG